MSPRDDRWYEAIVRADARDADTAADALSVAGAAGVSIEPALRIMDGADFQYEERMDVPWTVRASFPAPFEASHEQAVRDALAARTFVAPYELEIREAALVDWAEEWKKFYRTQHIGGRLVVRPSWEPYEEKPGEVVVQLDPGAAFGTGEHATTRLCLAAVEAHLRPDDRVLDVGSGSGILAVASRMLGAGQVHAVDIDAETVAVAIENAERNEVGEQIEFAAGSLGPDWPWPARAPEGYDLVLANISSLVIGRLASHLAAAARPGGLVVASGFIQRDADEVRGHLAEAGLVQIEYATEGEWGCFVARRG
ncbi:MAG: 50S ribosomal protein L11 methyltransferase [Dehalococcoidia bacterium]|nr:50S ribosomal protein L11 methyltransferase [Dehalococcoidia bacterium]